MNRRQKLIQQQFLNNEKRIIRRLDQVYAQALKDVNGNIERLMKRFDPDTGDLPQSAIYQLKYQNMVKDQLEGILNELQTKQFTSVAEYLDTCYEDGFVGSLFDLHGQDVPLMMPLDQEAMVTAVQLDSNISKGLYTRLGEDVSMLKKRITAEVSRSIATGASFADTAVHLKNRTRIGYNNAIRIARTEGHRIQNQATMNVMEQAKDRGADVVKQWDATLDGKTRDSHAQVDGEIRELDEKFSNGLQFPGDPSGKAEEVINCRCAALQRARWAVGDSFTKWNNFTRQLETFDSPQDYGEFKKAFFSDGNKRYMNYVQGLEKKYGTRDFTTILDRLTEREYDRYFDLMSKNPIFNGKAEVQKVKRMVDLVNFDDMESYLTTTYGLTMDRSVKGLNFENVRDAMVGCEVMFDEFPDLRNTIKLLKTNQSGIMSCDGTEINFNPAYFAVPHSALSYYCEQMAVRGWWSKNSDIVSLGVHECAHGVEWLLIMHNQNYTYDFERIDAWDNCTEAKLIISQACENIRKTLYGKGKTDAELIESISTYAKDSASEAMGEAFADVYVNGENASPLSAEIKRLTIEKLQMYKGG